MGDESDASTKRLEFTDTTSMVGISSNSMSNLFKGDVVVMAGVQATIEEDGVVEGLLSLTMLLGLPFGCNDVFLSLEHVWSVLLGLVPPC